MQSMTSIFQGVREYLTPVLQESNQKQGVLTPEEFVAAGDELVYKCPTWRWEGGEPSKRKPYLPPNKQYLVTNNVPCRKRVTNLEDQYAEETEVEDGAGEGEEEAWLATHSNVEDAKGEEVEDISSAAQSVSPSGKALRVNLMSAIVEEDHFGDEPVPPKRGSFLTGAQEEYADLASFEEDNLVEKDSSTLQAQEDTYFKTEEPDDVILRTRTYDISITYDKYYQTPRVWLFGYNEHGQPLSNEKIFEDIMQDYANRTVTIEVHPNLDIPHASIHPCQHAATMKRIIECLNDGGKEARTDQYMFIFLKFIQSVVPTIDYDYTMEVEAKS